MLTPITQSNLWFAIRVSGLLANSRKGIHNGQARVRYATFHTNVSVALCIPLQDPPLGSRVALEHSQEFLTFSPETSRDYISLTMYPICVFFSLLKIYFFQLSNGIRHVPFQHWKVFLCYFSVSEPIVNFQRN